MSCISYGDLMLVSEQAASIVNADVLSGSDTHTADATEPHHLCFTAKILLDQHRCWFLTNSHVYESATCGIPNVLCTFYGMVWCVLDEINSAKIPPIHRLILF